jgi:hypothetical protein
VQTVAATSLGPPLRGRPLVRAVGRVALRILGWRVVSDLPHLEKFVAVAAPHTSNWDFVVAVAAMFALDVRVRWLGKHTLFRWPFRGILRALGGYAVKRDTPDGIVQDVAAMIRSEPQIILGLAPEGTRKRVSQWRTGFYRIATAAEVPIVPVRLDWGRREVWIGAPMQPTGDMNETISILQANYSADMARHPKNFWGPIATVLLLAALAAPASAQTRWFRGNTHTHTLNSDGDSPPDSVARWYRDHGYSFLFITDHEKLTDPAPLNERFGKPGQFLLIMGQEVTQRVVDSSRKREPRRQAHMNSLGGSAVVLPQGITRHPSRITNAQR